MTIDELRARKQVLLERRRREEELAAQGRGDNMAMFFVREELLAVNAQLRSLAPKRRVAVRVTNSGLSMDREQFLHWSAEENSLDGEIQAGRRRQVRAAAQSVALLPERQGQVLRLTAAGLTPGEIARRLEISRSTVYVTRHIARTKARKYTAQLQCAREIRAEDSCRADLADPRTAKALLEALTPVQAAYFYLYYAEWMTLREIAALTGVADHTVVLRGIQRGLRRISRVFSGGALILENVEALDELACAVYLERREELDVPDRVGPERRAAIRSAPAAGRRGRNWPVREELPTVRVMSRGEERKMGASIKPGRARGKLLALLLERQRTAAEHPSLLGWLKRIFSDLVRNIR